MANSDLVTKVAEHVKAKFADEASGHDWWHLYRVWQLSKNIAQREKDADMGIVELGALLHDIADFKFHGNDLLAGPKAARTLLEEFGARQSVIKAVCHIVENVSFKGSGVANKMKSLEGKIVQDADRLDAIGAIGIARAFAYGGTQGRPFHDPGSQAQKHESFEAYANAKSTTINHFYEKLLLLKGLMNTDTGRKMAEHRHKFMEKYLAEFYAEWDGKI